ncbi:hypothetical protein AK812_SmicGene13206 [Symbiodinium microadriaticum]|uniref:Uncharacterized protein n=1 Tax=Symbiodinium microadriaticum TaxID=2951 RepID=A0A1Q9E8S3_SYMMI|nr:hypothetical protein AK812_SmicGene13206 [Symbiodinium microadriaticum]
MEVLCAPAVKEVRVIELQILEQRLDGEKVLGKVWLDAMEADHHKKTVQEPLYGEDGRKLTSQLLVKLATMGGSTVVSQDPVASSTGALKLDVGP